MAVRKHAFSSRSLSAWDTPGLSHAMRPVVQPASKATAPSSATVTRTVLDLT
jgi:hypothetical protein